MKRTKYFLLALVLALGCVAQAQETHVLLSEDFEGLELGPNVDEGLAGDAVWTDIPPAGWINDANDVPGIEDPATDGVTEWAGWGFADKDWWIQTAGDQRRSEFDLGQGTVAIADPDEWDDAGHPAVPDTGTYTVWLSTAPIDLSTSKPGTVELKFDSSWRPEYDSNYHQTGNIRVSFDGGEPIEILRWESEASSPNYKDDNSTNETITLDIDNPAGAMNMVLTFGVFDAGNDWWWAIDNIAVTAERNAKLAYNPSPEHGTDEVLVTTDLSWTPGEYVTGLSPQHQIILSDDLAAVEDGSAVVATQDPNSFDATGLLDFSTTYYWRIDEANSTSGWDEGNVWSFTTEAFIYPIESIVATSNGTSDDDEGPQNTVNGSGLNDDDQHSVASSDMWLATPPADESLYIQFEFDHVYKLYEMSVWNYNVEFELLLGFGIQDATIEYSENGTDWTALGDVTLNQATAKDDYTANTTIDMQGVPAKYVRLTANSSFGTIGTQGLSEVRFMQIPAHARDPQPADGATGVDVDGALTWKPGRDAASHEVYFGADPEALASVATPTATSYQPSVLDVATTYYWKVDETDATDGQLWPGGVWSFTTQEYLVVDDFESYDNDQNAIFDTWIDGWVNGTGSTVGYFTEPFAETTIVNSGRQSMPLAYENAGVSSSEADFDLNQDWTASGVQNLVLYVYGDEANSGGQLYVTINGTKVSDDAGAIDLASATWQAWTIDLSTVGNVSSVTSLTIGIDGAGASGIVYVDDIRLYP